MSKPANRKVKKAVRMDETLFKKIDAQAKQEHRNFSNMVNFLLLNAIKNYNAGRFRAG